VPAATDALLEAWHGLPVRVLTASTSGLTIHYDPPESMGADRLANTLALGERGKRPAIAVDCGTATTFTVVDAAGVVVGGAIAPGLGTAANALIGNAAQLPPIPLEHCPDPWGTNTVASLQLGMVEGHVGMIRHLVERFQAGLGGNAEVVLCGGWSGLLAERLSDYAWVPELTLEGGRVFGRKASLAAG